MHEYNLTGRAETDNCLRLANKAHNLYFDDVIRNKVQFINAASEFYDAIEQKFMQRNQAQDLFVALDKQYAGNKSKSEYFKTELKGIRKRLKILKANPNLANENTRFVLDHTARFMEVILPHACSVKEEVEHHRKFDYSSIVNHEMTFFKLLRDEEKEGLKSYVISFYDASWRTQKNLNGLMFVKNYLNSHYNVGDDPFIAHFFKDYGIYDYISCLTFARLANEQFLRYYTDKFGLYPAGKIIEKGRTKEGNPITAKIIGNDDKAITIPRRIEDLKGKRHLDELIANEAYMLNERGNNIVHQGLPGIFSTCYNCLELLNYYSKCCIKK